jgi:broad specificity phosphatase PhoE
MRCCKHILLIRHGLTDDNVAGIIQGHQQTSLNETGFQQARSLARRLGASGLELDALVSSDLLRAMQTAEAIAGVCGVPIIADVRWRERCFGPWEGKTADQVDIWRMAAGELDPPGAEPSVGFRDRVRCALVATAAGCPANGRLAIVTHGGPCRMVLRLLAGGELPMVSAASRPAIETIANCSIMHLEAHAGAEGLAWRLVRINDTDHLDPDSRSIADAG